ncbi:hypothetical protein ACVGWD_00200, partial [Enterobacter asburiae]
VGFCLIHQPALAVGVAAVVEHVQVDFVEVGVGFFYLIDHQKALGVWTFFYKNMTLSTKEKNFISRWLAYT